jgi:2-hydroxy-6-oxonona-2,4-dienedioate hydrolase
VLALDLPGWGRSQAVHYEQRDNSGAIGEFLDALGIAKAALVGNSMGGSSCIRLAYERPELVTHLVTLGSSSGLPGLFDAAGLTEGVKALEAAYFQPGRETMRRFIATMAFDSSYVTDEFIDQRVQAALARPEHLEGWKTGRQLHRRPAAEPPDRELARADRQPLRPLGPARACGGVQPLGRLLHRCRALRP